MSLVLWLVWFLAAVAVTIGQAKWQFDYFNHPGPAFHIALLAGLPAMLIATGVYLWLRRKGLWRYELRALTALGMCIPLFYEPRAFLVCVLVFLACYAFGRFVKSRAGLGGGPPLEDIVISAAIGFATFILALFAIGVAGGYYGPVIAALLFLVPAVLWRQLPSLWMSLRSVDESWRGADELRSPLAGFVVVFTAVFVVFAYMVILAPTVAFDVIYMHLPSALYYQSHHALLPVPDVDYSLFPQGVEVLMTVGLLLAGQPGAQMLPPVLFLLTALLLVRIVRAGGGSVSGAVCGAMFALTVPFIHWTGSVAKNDLALAFFELASLYCYIRWREDGRFRWIQIGAALLGAAFSIKDIVAFGAIPLALLFMMAAWRQPRRLRAMASLALFILLFGGCWHLRTLLMGRGLFLPPAVERAVTRAVVGTSPLTRIWRYVAIPWTVHFKGIHGFESPLSNPMGTFLLVFAPLWFLPLKKATPAERACLFFAGLYLVVWGVFFGLLRYSIAAVVPLCALTGERVVRLFERGDWRIRACVLAACSYVVIFAFTGSAIIELNGPQVAYFAGRLDKPGYLRQALATYSSLEFLGNVTVPGDTVASIGNCSTAYAPAGIHYESSCRDKDPLPWVVQGLSCQPFRFLILADQDRGRSIKEMLSVRRAMKQIYDDGRFSVYEVAQASACD